MCVADRQTERQIGRDTARNRQKQTDMVHVADRQTERQIGRHTARNRQKQTDRVRVADRQTERQVGRVGERERERQTERQTDKVCVCVTDRQADTYPKRQTNRKQTDGQSVCGWRGKKLREGGNGHFGNGRVEVRGNKDVSVSVSVTGRRTATMAAPLSHCGPVKNERLYIKRFTLKNKNAC